MSTEMTISIADSVAIRVKEFQEKGEIHFPANYSADNALKLAWLMIQETLDSNKEPVLKTCSKASIANALLNMVTQGLNPSKKQCYFIAKAGKLSCDVSYLGEKAKVKSLPHVYDVYESIVYKGDVLEFEINRGRKTISRHSQNSENVNINSIMGAYCIIEKTDGTTYTEYMSIEQITESWKKSKAWDNAKKCWRWSSPHQDQPDQMALRTVIKRACKHFFGTSDDSNLLLNQYQKSEMEAVDNELEEEMLQNANSEDVIKTEVEYEIETEVINGAGF